MESLNLLKAVILGIVEGATEFIPVSSTGHLILVQDWLNFTGVKENAFIIFIQLGAILAVVWLYREKLTQVGLNCIQDTQARQLIINLMVATIPAVIIGLPTEEWIETHFFNPYSVSLSLVFGGVAILWAEWRPHNPRINTIESISWQVALGIGCFQILAILFPGFSRSGATIMGGLLLGLTRLAATEFSFFMALPAMLGASAVKLFTQRDILSLHDLPLFATGFIMSFLAGMLAIRTLIRFISRYSFVPFAWYRIIFGMVLIAVYWNHHDGF